MNPLKALRSAPFGTYVSDTISQRYDPMTGLKGMYCVKKGGIPAETLVACLPVFGCISPSTVLSSRAGAALAQRLRPEGYEAVVGGSRMAVTKDSMLVAAFTAMSMNKGPLREYLANISTERDVGRLRGTLKELSQRAGGDGDALVRRYDDLQLASAEVLKAVHEDVMMGAHSSTASSSSSLNFSLDQLIAANALCESRVLSIPSDDGSSVDDDAEGEGAAAASSSSNPSAAAAVPEDVLGGPAFVPWVDLINHSDAPSNIAAVVMRTDTGVLPPAIARIAPLCIVAATRRDVKCGDEITYEYMEPIPNAKETMVIDGNSTPYENHLLLWATRFHFIPPHMQ